MLLTNFSVRNEIELILKLGFHIVLALLRFTIIEINHILTILVSHPKTEFFTSLAINNHVFASQLVFKLKAFELLGSQLVQLINYSKLNLI